MNSTTNNCIRACFLALLFFYYCNQIACQRTIDFSDLRKLSEDEMVERARTGTFADPTKVTYMLESGDTISFESLQSLDQQTPIAIDDYVDDNGEVVISLVREFTENDKVLKSRMLNAYNEYSLGDINGTLINEIVTSQFLDEERILNIYLPAHSSESTPVIYLTDGGYDDSLISIIDNLISTNKIEPIIMVGVPSSVDHRFEEYVQRSNNSTRFENHMIFFKTEVIDHLEKNILRRKVRQQDRYISGNSNGGDFSVSFALLNPSLFNTAVSFSGVALGDKLESFDHTSANNKTAFYIGVGSKEKDAVITNKNTVATLEEHGRKVDFIQYNSGHDYDMWKEQFILFLTDRFSQMK